LLSRTLTLDDFKPVQLEDKQLFDDHYKNYPPVHSDNLFATMLSWMDYSDYQYVFLNDNLVIKTKIRDNTQFRLPSGKFNKELFNLVLELAKKEGSDPPVELVDLQTKNWIEKVYPKIKFKPDRDFFDYVYLASDLAELPGSSFSKIRNRLNKFKRNYVYKTEAISKNNFNEIREFLKRWCLWKDCDSDPLLESEKKAILFSMDHYFDLGLLGIAMRINDNIEAISVFEHMSSDTSVIHYEKGSPDFDGIYKAINMEAAKILQNNYAYINRESDMNLPGLRKAKMSYRPHHLVEVFHIDRQYIYL